MCGVRVCLLRVVMTLAWSTLAAFESDFCCREIPTDSSSLLSCFRLTGLLVTVLFPLPSPPLTHLAGHVMQPLFVAVAEHMTLKVDVLNCLDAVQLLWLASQAQLGNTVYMQGLVYRCIEVRAVEGVACVLLPRGRVSDHTPLCGLAACKHSACRPPLPLGCCTRTAAPKCNRP